MKYLILLTATIHCFQSLASDINLSDLYETHTIIYSGTWKYEVKESSSDSLQTIESSLFKPLSSNEECAQFDKSGKYDSYIIKSIVEVTTDDGPQLSPFVEGVRMNGLVKTKYTDLCFAKK